MHWKAFQRTPVFLPFLWILAMAKVSMPFLMEGEGEGQDLVTMGRSRGGPFLLPLPSCHWQCQCELVMVMVDLHHYNCHPLSFSTIRIPDTGRLQTETCNPYLWQISDSDFVTVFHSVRFWDFVAGGLTTKHWWAGSTSLFGGRQNTPQMSRKWSGNGNDDFSDEYSVQLKQHNSCTPIKPQLSRHFFQYKWKLVKNNA